MTTNAGTGGEAGNTGQGAGAAGAGGTGTSAGAGGAANGGAPAVPEWLNGCAPETIGLIQNAKWEKPQDVANGYAEMVKFRGATEKELIKIPKTDDAKGWEDAMIRLGAGDKVEAYAFKAPEGVSVDADMDKWFRQTVFDEKIPVRQAEGLYKKYNEMVQARNGELEKAAKVQSDLDMHNLRKEWGKAFDENINLAQRAAKQYGVSPETLSRMEMVVGTGELMKLWAAIGKGQGEHKFVDGGAKGGGMGQMTPQQAAARKSEIMASKEEAAKYLAGDPKLKAEMLMLEECIAAGLVQ